MCFDWSDTNTNDLYYVDRLKQTKSGKYELTIDLAPNVWLHSSVGRASHQYKGGHGFESR